MRYKYILESAGSINWMAISALLTFVTVFWVSAIMAFRSPLGYLNKMFRIFLWMIPFFKHRKLTFAMKKNKLKKQLVITLLALLSSLLWFLPKGQVPQGAATPANNDTFNFLLGNGMIFLLT